MKQSFESVKLKLFGRSETGLTDLETRPTARCEVQVDILPDRHAVCNLRLWRMLRSRQMRLEGTRTTAISEKTCKTVCRLALRPLLPDVTVMHVGVNHWKQRTVRALVLAGIHERFRL